MLRKFLVTGFFLVSAIALSVTDAHAQFAGWGWFGFSSVVARVETVHTPNPTAKPSQIVVDLTGTIQIACVNPATNGLFVGKAFRTTFSASGSVGSDPLTGIIGEVSGGKATTFVVIPLDQFESPSNCTNSNWTPVEDSAATLDFTGNIKWCLLDANGVPNCTGRSLLDSETVSCVLDTARFPRGADGTYSQYHDEPGEIGVTLTCNNPQS